MSYVNFSELRNKKVFLNFKKDIEKLSKQVEKSAEPKDITIVSIIRVYDDKRSETVAHSYDSYTSYMRKNLEMVMENDENDQDMVIEDHKAALITVCQSVYASGIPLSVRIVLAFNVLKGILFNRF